MALGGLVISSLLFVILLIDLLLFIISLVLLVIFSIKKKKVLQILCLILTLIFLFPLLLTKTILNDQNKVVINYEGKDIKVPKDVVNKYNSKITSCNINELNKLLKEYPELINSKTQEGLYSLGLSIKYKKIDCIKYYIDKKVDINNISSNNNYGTLEYMFKYSYYNDEILDYILNLEGLDINKKRGSLPVAQLYFKSIIKDNEISDKEIEYFKLMIDKGLDLNDTNGSNTNTYDYINNKDYNKVTNIKKLRKIIKK